MTIKAFFTAIVLSFTVANTSTEAKAAIPVGELFEAIHLAKEGFDLLEPIIKPVAKKATKGIFRFAKKRKQQWDNYRAAKKAKKNTYVSPARILADLDEDTITATHDAVAIKHSKSVPTELAEDAKIVKPAPIIRSRSMPTDLAELGL